MNSNTFTPPASLGWSPAAQIAAMTRLFDLSTAVVGRLVELNVANLRRQGASNLSHLKSLAEVRDFSTLVSTQRQFLQASWQYQEESMKAACRVLQQGMEEAQTALRPAPPQSAAKQPVVAQAKKPIPAATSAPSRTTTAKVATAPKVTIAPTADASRAVFEIYQDKAGEYRFRLQGLDGRTLLRSEGYRKRRGAVNGINAVKKNASNDARYERQSSPTGKPSFNLKAGNHQVIGSSRTFSTTAQMDTAIELIKETAPVSKVRDLTAAA